jgi:biopolymer transport protein ExbD
MKAKPLQFVIVGAFTVSAFAIVTLDYFVMAYVWRTNQNWPTENVPREYFRVNLDRDGNLVMSEETRLNTPRQIQRYMSDQFDFLRRDRGEQQAKEMVVVVRGDSDTSFDQFTQVMRAARDAGFVNIYLRESAGLGIVISVEARLAQIRTLIVVLSVFTVGVIAILVVLLFLARFLVRKNAAAAIEKDNDQRTVPVLTADQGGQSAPSASDIPAPPK